MADGGSINPGIRLDIHQLQLEAQHRWLRPAEICEILRNYQNFQISSEAPNRPPSGSLFLFDRRVLRYFRKDDHNWRKKSDGKTVKEAHEKLKVGSIDVLHCYYARGGDREFFYRRSYWLLEEESMHIVFVHYLEIKGNRSSNRATEPVISNSQTSNSLPGSFSSSYNEAHTGNYGSPSAASTLSSTYEDVESDQYEEGQFPVPGLDVSLAQNGAGINNENQFRTVDLGTWVDVFEECAGGSENLPYDPLFSSTVPIKAGTGEGFNENFSWLLDDFGVNFGSGGSSSPQNLQRNNSSGFASMDFQDTESLLGSMKEDGLQKVDSFSKWATKELVSVEDLNLKSSSNFSWKNMETAAAVDDALVGLENYSMSPSIGQEQLYNIHDFSPSCASTDSETKVVITGKFLVMPSEISKYHWSCMFGEVEVPAENTGDGVLCCYAPLHKAGRVPFYVTCSNRFSCSQVREFEFLAKYQQINSLYFRGSSVKDRRLLVRLEKLLYLRSHVNAGSVFYDINKKPIIDDISLLMEGELCYGVERRLIDKVLAWLVYKVNEDGKGPNILDEEGQGLLHLAAVLGYDWIIPPTLASGVSVNFRDAHGLTALHWAASSGREDTVALLITLGAAPGALSDPSPEFPLGRTPADLASANGYKGISGFLAESSLTAHLASLTLTNQPTDSSLEKSILEAVKMITERVATPGYNGNITALSLKDSLAAVRNATQAAGRIHQVFRMQSFQRKQINDHLNDDCLLTDERVLSLISSRVLKPRTDELSQTAALRIQKKFRGWKQRREFMIIRERVVRIQALVRGNQVRGRYKTVVWSVGIIEKLIRWKNKINGLRVFRSDVQSKASTSQANSSEEDEYDYLKKGRKQSEERLQKALVRVKSMVQYPEGRAQYHRLLTAFQKHQQQPPCNKTLSSAESVVVAEGEEGMIEVQSLLDDDNFMAIAYE